MLHSQYLFLTDSASPHDGPDPISIRLMCDVASLPGKLSDQAGAATNIIPSAHKYNYGVGTNTTPRTVRKNPRRLELKTKCGKKGAARVGLGYTV